jgi:hypothetical protein
MSQKEWKWSQTPPQYYEIVIKIQVLHQKGEVRYEGHFLEANTFRGFTNRTVHQKGEVLCGSQLWSQILLEDSPTEQF